MHSSTRLPDSAGAPARLDVVLVMILLGAACLRLPGLFDDFWLDEIWSYRIARELHGLLDVLVSPTARVDNNNPLYTALLLTMGQDMPWWVYRLPAFFAGVASVAVTAAMLAPCGRRAARVGTLLVGCSYPLVFYSSEARGYALVVLFALLAFATFLRELERPSRYGTAVFAAACVLGLLSHLSFVYVYTGMLAASAWHAARSRATADAFRDLVRLHAVPIACTIALYVGFVRHLTIGGAPDQSTAPALAEAIAALAVAAGSLQANVATCLAVAVALCGTIAWTARRRPELAVFLVVALVVAPTLVLLRQLVVLELRQAIYPRHFLVLLPFFLIGAASVGVELPRRPATRRVASTVLAAFVAVNLWQTARFVEGTRGHYADAVRYLFDETPGATVAVVSDHPTRTRFVLEFHARRLAREKRLVVIDEDATSRPPETPMWVIAHGFVAHAPPGDTCTDPVSGAIFRLDREFGFAGLSGYSWYVYRRADG